VTIYALPRFVLSPKGRVGLGLGGVERAAVPEAAVDENGEFARTEDEVGFYAEFLQLQTFNFPLERSSPPPAGDAVGAKDRDEPQLGGRVAARADGRHDGGAFSLRKDVGHERGEPVRVRAGSGRDQTFAVRRIKSAGLTAFTGDLRKSGRLRVTM